MTLLLAGPEMVSTTARRQQQVGVQVAPDRIVLFDQGELPLPLPSLQLLFASDSVVNFTVVLPPDESFAAVLFGETVKTALLVVVDTREQIAGDADVYGAVPLASQDVDGYEIKARHVERP